MKRSLWIVRTPRKPSTNPDPAVRFDPPRRIIQYLHTRLPLPSQSPPPGIHINPSPRIPQIRRISHHRNTRYRQQRRLHPRHPANRRIRAVHNVRVHPVINRLPVHRIPRRRPARSRRCTRRRLHHNVIRNQITVRVHIRRLPVLLVRHRPQHRRPTNTNRPAVQRPVRRRRLAPIRSITNQCPRRRTADRHRKRHRTHHRIRIKSPPRRKHRVRHLPKAVRSRVDPARRRTIEKRTLHPGRQCPRHQLRQHQKIPVRRRHIHPVHR